MLTFLSLAHMGDATQCTSMQLQCTCYSEPAYTVRVYLSLRADGNRAWKNECCRLGLKHKRVSHARMQFVVRDKKPLKGKLT